MDIISQVFVLCQDFTKLYRDSKKCRFIHKITKNILKALNCILSAITTKSRELIFEFTTFLLNQNGQILSLTNSNPRLSDNIWTASFSCKRCLKLVLRSSLSSTLP